jgi:hypothetical protein
VPTVLSLRTTTSQKCAAVRGGLVFKDQRLRVSLSARLESNEQEKKWGG